MAQPQRIGALAIRGAEGVPAVNVPLPGVSKTRAPNTASRYGA